MPEIVDFTNEELIAAIDELQSKVARMEILTPEELDKLGSLFEEADRRGL
jgi:hypothetical protein